MKPQGDETICQDLIQLFAQIPPDREEIESVFRTYDFSPEQLAEIAYETVGDCEREYRDALDDAFPDVTLENMHSDHLLDSLRQLLEHGWNPNLCFGEYHDNAMWDLQYVDAPNIGAAAMRLLLENGADPNLHMPGESETLFEFVEFKVADDSYTHEYVYVVQCVLVLLAYGGCWEDGSIPLTMLNGNRVDIFRDFEHYDYVIEMLPQKPGYFGCWIMHIFDTRTKEVVACYQ